MRAELRPGAAVAYEGDDYDVEALEARPGDVSKILAPYLHWRTGGVMGSISALLREGAALAIERGAERLSESLLDEVEVDADAEGQAARRKRPAPSALAPGPS